MSFSTRSRKEFLKQKKLKGIREQIELKTFAPTEPSSDQLIPKNVHLPKEQKSPLNSPHSPQPRTSARYKLYHVTSQHVPLVFSNFASSSLPVCLATSLATYLPIYPPTYACT